MDKLLIWIVPGIQSVIIFVASTGDATVGALITGVFLLINTLVTIHLTTRAHRGREHTQEVRQDSDSGTDRHGSVSDTDIGGGVHPD